MSEQTAAALGTEETDVSGQGPVVGGQDEADVSGQGPVVSGQDETAAVEAPPAEAPVADVMAGFSREQLLAVIENGGAIPDEFLAKDEAVVEAPAVDAVDGVDKAVEAEAAAEPEAETAAEAAEAAVEIPTEFVVADPTDIEARDAAREEAINAFDAPPLLKGVIEDYKAELAELRAAPKMDETAATHMQAFDQLVTYKPDPDEEGVFVPDTEGLRRTIREQYPNEYRQVIVDLNQEESAKYPGQTRFQEFMRDGLGLDDHAMNELNAFIDRGGRFDVPKWVPEGLDPSFAEAYFTHPQKDAYDERLTNLQYRIANGTAEEKEQAVAEVQTLNRELKMIQDGIDSRNAARQQVIDSQINARRAVIETADRNFSVTASGLMDNAVKGLAKVYAATDGDAAGATAAGHVSLVYGALSPYPDVAEINQSLLKKEGVTHDWTAARAVVDKWWQAEQAVVAAETAKAHPRAVEKARENLKDALLAMKGIEKELTGKLAGKRVKGAGEAIKTQIKNAPKIPVGGKARVAADAKPVGSKPDYTTMAPEELRSRIGEMRRQAAEQGIKL